MGSEMSLVNMYLPIYQFYFPNRIWKMGNVARLYNDYSAVEKRNDKEVFFDFHDVPATASMIHRKLLLQEKELRFLFAIYLFVF
ncbi:hypothetical protein VNO77_36136 [Canavalia gladiata]|uniref:Uncharacterized protein n=1 Tax=Canavalia gladiata TaxID=3824 RepID=A0AAN9PXJ5_CANGL